MSEISSGHAHRMPLTTDPARHPDVFAAAFNSGEAATVEAVYEEQGILIRRPGTPVVGTERRAANAALQDLGVPITVTPRQVYVADDIALLIVDWAIIGVGADGKQVDVSGTATDVARRGTDGRWRYIIDNPFGVARSTE